MVQSLTASGQWRAAIRRRTPQDDRQGENRCTPATARVSSRSEFLKNSQPCMNDSSHPPTKREPASSISPSEKDGSLFNRFGSWITIELASGEFLVKGTG